jgi:RNA polymerase subunit RPABC4/transcription elongation factor Spt4
MSVNQAYGTASYVEAKESFSPRTPGERVRRIMPKRKCCPKCTKENNFLVKTPDIDDNFCPTCGTELEEFVADMYVTIDREQNDPGYYENIKLKEKKTEQPELVNKYPEPPRKERPDTRIQISLRDLVALLKEYEKEMVVENI